MNELERLKRAAEEPDLDACAEGLSAVFRAIPRRDALEIAVEAVEERLSMLFREEHGAGPLSRLARDCLRQRGSSRHRASIRALAHATLDLELEWAGGNSLLKAIQYLEEALSASTGVQHDATDLAAAAVAQAIGAEAFDEWGRLSPAEWNAWYRGVRMGGRRVGTRPLPNPMQSPAVLNVFRQRWSQLWARLNARWAGG